MSDMLIDKGQKVKRNKPKRLQDKKHLKFVAAQPCCCCGNTPVQCHHLLRGPVRGVGLRAGDDKVIPLCFSCHSQLHNSGNEIEFLAQYCIDGMELANTLWQESGDMSPTRDNGEKPK